MDQEEQEQDFYETTARMALMRAQRIAALWDKPVLTDEEIPLAVGLAASSYHAIKARGEGPPSFNIGRRKFSLTDDVRAWLGSRAKEQQAA